MMRVERLVVPEAKSFCSTRSVRFPCWAHSRAIATPLMPPPITSTSKPCAATELRNGIPLLTLSLLDAVLGKKQRITSPSHRLGWIERVCDHLGSRFRAESAIG